MNDALTTDLMIWIIKQSSNHLLRWLLTFEHLERKDLNNDVKTYTNNEGGKRFHAMISSAGYNPFFFQGKLFVLQKTDDDNNGGWDSNSGTVTLRCLWGSVQLVEDLLNAVRKGAKCRDIVAVNRE